ncbi:unnamed protein product [Paramecium sonneborni]|uniref:ROK family protein n=1 Tax=Paramecium sonneborni TaxID=65129 RepID=A0A8S1QGY8_9CILI|nr:unnamed protein product [Paramecium sonneborni]
MKQSKAALEIGGTFIQVGIGEKVENKWMITNKKTFDTRDPQETVIDLVQYLEQFEFDSIQIASFGPLCLNKDDPQYGSITSTPKLKWQNFPIAACLSQKLNKPFAIDTDVNACAMAEFMLGNQNSYLQQAIIMQDNHQLIQQLEQVLASVQLQMDNVFMECYIQKEVIFYFLNKRKIKISKEFVLFMEIGLCTNVAIAKRLNCPITELPNVSDDHPIWQLIGFYLAEACQNLLYLLSIEKIVLGGGVMNRKILYSIIDQRLRTLVNNYVQIPQNYVVEPQVQDVGLIGALLLQ